MRVVTIAAGDGQRWRNYLGVPKHLAPVDGVPLLHRTVNLIHAAGIDNVYVTGRTGGTLGRGLRRLGLSRNDRTLVINEGEAELVRAIFQLYVDLGNVPAVEVELA